MEIIRDRKPEPRKIGAVLHSPLLYDAQIWLATLGRVQAFRDRLLAIARLAPGEAVLDIGCGTGGLAITAKLQVGPDGTVHGIDASPEMIGRAKRKAKRANVDVAFETAPAQALPFPDAEFDVILSTIMFHHLSRKARQQCAAEIRRVLKPGGRLLLVEFGHSAHAGKGLFAHFHQHGYVKLSDLLAVLSDAGLQSLDSGLVGKCELVGGGDLQFVLVTPGSAGASSPQGNGTAS